MTKIPFLKKGSTISSFYCFTRQRLLMVKILLKPWIYEEPSEADGYRILLDRLWPRGLKKEDAKFDEWRKDITPSKELRQWFHEDKDRHWEVFQGRYGMEIKQNPDFIPFLREIEKHPVVTFLTAAKDVQHSHLPQAKSSKFQGKQIIKIKRPMKSIVLLRHRQKCME